MIENPFDIIEKRLERMERHITSLIHIIKEKETKAKYLTVKEASLMLNRSKSSLYRLTMNDSIPCRRVNGRLFFIQSELESFIEGNGKT